MFPIFHTGRPWLAYWLLPYPNAMTLWPNFRSPLIWDVFAVSTYGSVSALFWFIGLIPDLATFRDKAENPIIKRVYGMLALGWRGSAIHWARYEHAYLLLAGLSTPLRAMYGLHDFITMRHLENMAKVTLVTGLVVVYGYFCELFFGWYSANEYERFMLKNRIYYGPYAWTYWVLLLCNFLVPQLMWSKRMRHSLMAVFTVSMFINVGMWLERFVIIVTSLHRDFLPSSWEMYYPTKWDFITLAGTIGLFLTLMFVFVRLLPMIAITEVKMLLPQRDQKATAEGG